MGYRWVRRKHPDLPARIRWPFSPSNRRSTSHRPTPILYGFSAHVIPKPPDWGEHVHITGYWHLVPTADWNPPAALAAFLEAGLPPVYIGFGSMITKEAPRLMQAALKALAQTGQRGLLLTGWGGLSEADLPDSVFRIESAPHSWLFPRMAACVHHGGAGTTAAALRTGVPSVVTPFAVDQPFWGRRVFQLGVGPKPIPRKKLTTEKLAEAIHTATRDRSMQRRAADLGERMGGEDGVSQTVEIIERYLVSGS